MADDIKDKNLEQPPVETAKNAVDELVSRRYLTEAQTESKKRKEKIKNLKQDIEAKDAEILNYKGLDSKINALIVTLKHDKITSEMDKLGLTKEAAELIRPLVEGHITVDSETYTINVNIEEIDKLRILFPKQKPDEKPKILQDIFKRKQTDNKAPTTLERLRAEADALQGRK